MELNNKSFSLFIFLYISIILSSSYVSSKWTVKITEPSTQSPFILQKGFYKKFLVTITSLDKNEPRAKGILNLKNEEIVFSDDISIDTHIATEFEVYIGTSCSSNIEIGKEYTISPSVDGDDTDAFEVTTFSLKFEEFVQEIEMEKTMESIGNGGYGLYSIKQKLYNVDMITVVFLPAPTTSTKSDVDHLSLDTFSPIRPRKEQYKYYNTQYESDKTHQVFKMEIRSERSLKCFKLKTNEFSFTTTNDELITFDDEKKEKILKNIKISAPSDDVIEFNIDKLEYSPFMLSCVIQSHLYKINFPTDEEIRFQDFTKSDKFDFYQYFVKEPQQLNIKFKSLSRNDLFRVKCLVDNNAYEDTKLSNTSFVIGNINSDLPTELKRAKKIETKSTCVKWTFEDWVDASSFSNKVLNKCNDAIKATFPENNKDFYQNGCVQCTLIDSVFEASTEICGYALPSCDTNYDKDIGEILYNLADTLKDKRTIEKEFGFENYVVKNIRKLQDSGDLFQDNVKVTVTKIGNGAVEFQLENKNAQPIDCYPHTIDKTPFSQISLFDFEYINNYRHRVPAGQAVSALLMFPTLGPDNLFYDIIFTCVNSISLQTHLQQTQPFVLASVIHTDKEKKDDDPEEKHDCTKNPFDIECLKRDIHSFVFKSKNPKVDHKEDIEKFIASDNPTQKIFLEGQRDILNTLIVDIQNKKAEIINQIIFMAELLERRDCSKFVNFHECEKSKKEYGKLLTESLSKIYECEKIVEQIKEIGGSYTDNLKLYTIAIFELTNNPDIYSQNDELEKLFTLSYCAVNKTDILIKDADSDESKIDIVNLITSIQGNIFDLFPFAEVEDLIKFKRSDDIITNNTLKNHTSYLEKSIKNLWPYYPKEGEFIHDNVYVKFIKLEANDYANADFTELSFDNGNIKVSIPVKDLLKEHHRTLMQFVFYSKYPYISVNNTYVSKSFISISVYNEESKQKGFIPYIDKSFRPKITFQNSHYNENFTLCYNFDIYRQQLNQDGTTKVVNNDKTITQCEVSLFSDFSIGDNSPPLMATWLVILLSSLGGAICIAGAILIYCFCFKKKNKDPRISEVPNEPLIKNEGTFTA